MKTDYEHSFNDIDLDSLEANLLLNKYNPRITKITISDCTGTIPRDLRHFPNLREFECVNTKMHSMPILGDSVHTILCDNNELRIILLFPPSLFRLEICNNYIEEMPMFPLSLQSVALISCRLSSIQEDLHEGLRDINVTYNRLRRFPDKLPDSLELLCILGNFIENLPPRAGAKLAVLNCASNRLDKLPHDFATAYPGLQDFNCLNNPIAKIDSLPDSIRDLRLDHLRLTTYRFPVPANLEAVCCDIGWVRELAKINRIIPIIGYSREPRVPGYMIRQIDRFRELYFAVKLRDRFRKWALRSQEKRILEELSPLKLAMYLQEHNADEADIEGATDAFFGV